ncbi:hypothetical protein [Bacillus sp. S14(2024)]|uniref:hypothetical protein n=1 Tax=Bacillus sp. S14(2024) TaxID=3162884 RepID=UPI003D1AAEF9
MSDWAARNSFYRDYKDNCNFCGCEFRVEVPTQDGHNESEEYYCPECYKEYKVRASNSPRVTLISGRTDGRKIKYQDCN